MTNRWSGVRLSLDTPTGSRRSGARSGTHGEGRLAPSMGSKEPRSMDRKILFVTTDQQRVSGQQLRRGSLLAPSSPGRPSR
jgi:hypothetical protein